MATGPSDVCFTCKFAFKGRNHQNLSCFICHEVVHRTCLPGSSASTDYVRVKKLKEAFHFKCAACFHGTTSASLVFRKRKQPAQQTTDPSYKRICKVPNSKTSFPPLPRVARTRPGAIVLSARHETRY